MDNSKKKQQGVTLVELVLVILALAAVIMVISNLPSSISAISRNRHHSIARDAASKQIENLRRLGYDNLPTGGTFSDVSLLDLPFATANFTVDDCPIEICTTGDPVKEPAKVVLVSVGWNEQGDQKQVEMTTIISKGGLGQ